MWLIKDRCVKLSVCVRKATEKPGVIGACLFLRVRDFLDVARVDKVLYS